MPAQPQKKLKKDDKALNTGTWGGVAILTWDTDFDDCRKDDSNTRTPQLGERLLAGVNELLAEVILADAAHVGRLARLLSHHGIDMSLPLYRRPNGPNNSPEMGPKNPQRSLKGLKGLLDKGLHSTL